MAEDYKAKVVDAVKKLKYTRRRVKQLVIDARDTADSVPSYSDFNPIKIVERATLEIIDESKIPKEYFKQVVTEKLDREKILNDMKDGKKIPVCDIIKDFGMVNVLWIAISANQKRKL